MDSIVDDSHRCFKVGWLDAHVTGGMVHEFLFMKRLGGASELSQHARIVFSALGLEDYEERFSSNYPPDDHYYVARATNGAVEVSDADDSDLPQYQYWVVITDWRRSESHQTLPSTDPREIANALSLAGLELFLPSSGWAQIGWDRTGEHFPPSNNAPNLASDA